MKTLAQFKRELPTVKALTMLECSFPNSLLGIKRELAHTDTVQFALWTERKGEKKKSYMYYPKASEYSYDEKTDTFKISQGNDYFIYKIYR